MANLNLRPAARLNTFMLMVGVLILVAILVLQYGEWTEYHRASSDAARSRDVLVTVNRPG